MGNAIQTAVAEGTGTFLLLVAIVGSGVMGDRLFPGVEGSALLVNAAATGAALAAIIAALISWSAHFNPAVSLVAAFDCEVPWSRVPGLIVPQLAGAVLGVICANLMFDLPAVEIGTTVRDGSGRLLGEALATFGLVLVIKGARVEAIPWAVGLYVAAAIWFTSSTAFANPAVTMARMLTDSFCGIRPVDVLPFVLAQLGGALVAALLVRWLRGDRSP